MAVSTRAGKAAQNLSVARMMGFETASKMLGGQRHVSDALGIGERALRAKLTAERGISYSDLTLTAKELRRRAATLIGHADKLQALADNEASA